MNMTGGGNAVATVIFVWVSFSNYRLYFCLFGSKVLYS